MRAEATVTYASGTPSLTCSDFDFVAYKPSNLDKSSVFGALDASHAGAWTVGGSVTEDTFCMQSTAIKMYDGTTDGLALTRF